VQATGIAPAVGKQLVYMDFYLHGYNNTPYSSLQLLAEKTILCRPFQITNTSAPPQKKHADPKFGAVSIGHI